MLHYCFQPHCEWHILMSYLTLAVECFQPFVWDWVICVDDPNDQWGVGIPEPRQLGPRVSKFLRCQVFFALILFELQSFLITSKNRNFDYFSFFYLKLYGVGLRCYCVFVSTILLYLLYRVDYCWSNRLY